MTSFGNVQHVFTFTIDFSDDDQVSQESHNVAGYNHYAIKTPASLDSTAIRFQAADVQGQTTGSFAAVQDDAGNRASVVCSSSAEYIALTTDGELKALRSCQALKLDMGSQETGDRTILLIARV